MKIKFFNNLSLNMKLTLACILGLLIVGLIFYPLIPTLLNYPPDSVNTDFQLKVNIWHYNVQYLAVVCFVIIIFLLILPLFFRKINKIENITNYDVEHNKDLLSIIKTCFNFPLGFLLIVFILPPIFIFIALIFITAEFEFSLKTTFVLFSMTSLMALLIYSFSRFLFENILKKIQITNSTYGVRVNVKNKMLLQLIPLLFFTSIFAFLIFYSQFSTIKGDALFDYYKQAIVTTFEDKQVSSIKEAQELLETIPLKSGKDSIFILDADGNTYYSKEDLSDFFKTYIFDFEEKHNGHTYEYYGNPTQGAFIRENINGQDWILGIRYSAFTNDTLASILPLFGIIIIINLFFIITMAIDYGNSLKVVVNNLSNISKNADDNYMRSKLPVYSNDEIGDLTIAFNNIQDLTQSYITQLHNNQDLLMERERLASLGQLIGGIAHNLKTPIMSISGASEGLTDLIKEYDASIGDPDITPEDHHAIAKEMYDWVAKVKSYTEYMSDIITTVKGQAVTLSEEQVTAFDLEELVKRVDILMKHELKNALVTLNVNIKTNPHTVLHGNIVSLVQVIDNMISNSIQAYNGEPNKEIDLTISKKKNNIVISIKDYGPGLPREVKKKLFKEMITTKGKNGTGLGLFMSYSNIRAHFNGNITFETKKGKGTVFNIILPLE